MSETPEGPASGTAQSAAAKIAVQSIEHDFWRMIETLDKVVEIVEASDFGLASRLAEMHRLIERGLSASQELLDMMEDRDH